jgi:hypothetical protein
VFPDTPLASWRLDGQGYASVILGDTVYVGGSFGTATSPDGSQTATRHNLAAFDLATGELRPDFVVDTDGLVRDLVVDGDRLFVAGDFSTIGGVARARLASVDLTTGSVEARNPRVNASVYKIAVGGGKLVLGGNFNYVGGQFHDHLAVVSVATAAVDPGFVADVDKGVTAVAISGDGSRIWVGGGYTTINGQPAATLTALDDQGDVLPIGYYHATGAALDIKVVGDGTWLAVSGDSNYVGWWNAATGDRRWIQYCGGDGQAVGVLGSYTYGGFHDNCDDDTTIRLSRNTNVRGTRDTTFHPSWLASDFWGVRDISGDNTVMVVAGQMTWLSGVHVGGFAIFPAVA